MIVVSTGCPSGIGPEVSVAAAARLRTKLPRVLVGNWPSLVEAAELVDLPVRRLERLDGDVAPRRAGIFVLDPGPPLSRSERKPGKPSPIGGRAQLTYVEAALAYAKSHRGGVLVTGPVSKAAIARSGLRRARSFRGHTEWLRDLDGAAHAIMCFQFERFSTSLVTTHVPLGEVPGELDRGVVSDACVELANLLRGLGKRRPTLAVVSLNPHAGEAELLGVEETQAIVPGIERATRKLGRKAKLSGPMGAETAYRLANSGKYDGVVAMYHDQATIPMKLLAFGQAVNVTMGLSVVRTSVDHGTGYDIAGRGIADPSGMLAAMRLAERLGKSAAR